VRIRELDEFFTVTRTRKFVLRGEPQSLLVQYIGCAFVLIAGFPKSSGEIVLGPEGVVVERHGAVAKAEGTVLERALPFLAVDTTESDNLCELLEKTLPRRSLPCLAFCWGYQRRIPNGWDLSKVTD